MGNLCIASPITIVHVRCIPSLDKSTGGFCRHKYSPDIACRVDRRQPACLSALPWTPFLPCKNSAGLFGKRKSDDGKEEDTGILAYAKDDDTVSADLHRRKACVSLLSEGIGCIIRSSIMCRKTTIYHGSKDIINSFQARI